MPFSLQFIVSRVLQFYSLLIIVYVILTWFPISGFFEDVFRVLATIVEPYLVIFRRIVPTFGMLDFSPFVAILVLWAIQAYLVPLIPF
jgi:YggT family protein